MDLALTVSLGAGALLLAYTFAGYPLLALSLGRLRPAPTTVAADDPDLRVSVVLVARNEIDRIIARIENLLDTHHPQNKLQIIVVTDGSTDGTPGRVAAWDHPQVQLIEADSHRGKPDCVNDGVAAATGDVVVFADARQRFDQATIPQMISQFSDPAIGAVSGELHIEPSDSTLGQGVDTYWKLERAIRLGESRFDSSIGVTGAVYAIRRSCFTPLPADTILDDVVCPMQIALSGRRVTFAPEAKAFDPQSLDPALEKRRKRRTLAGNFQMLFRYPGWLVPWKNRLWFQLVSHKYLRLVAPMVLLQVFVTSLILASRGSQLGVIATVGQSACYLLAAIGMAFPRLNWKTLSIPAGFVFLNMMTVRGFAEYLTKRGRIGW